MMVYLSVDDKIINGHSVDAIFLKLKDRRFHVSLEFVCFYYIPVYLYTPFAATKGPIVQALSTGLNLGQVDSGNSYFYTQMTFSSCCLDFSFLCCVYCTFIIECCLLKIFLFLIVFGFKLHVFVSNCEYSQIVLVDTIYNGFLIFNVYLFRVSSRLYTSFDKCLI